ncbi:MAG: hypothetical protein DI539_30155 [Flavobacterium psychrophilum]|nr:MAG: hypothetical protein DI539_30155 [Flavobacterium psychrophilum]
MNQYSPTPPSNSIEPTQLACILFSEYFPNKLKGIMIEHQSIICSIKQSNHFEIEPSTIVLQTCSFDNSISFAEIFGTFLNGSSLCVISEEYVFKKDFLLSLLKQYEITTAFFSKDLLLQFCQKVPYIFNCLRLVLLTDTVPTETLVKIRQGNASLRITYCYQLLENTLHFAFIPVVEHERLLVSICPAWNTGVYIFNKKMLLQNINNEGELYIIGNSLPRGFWNNNQLTSEKIIDDPYNSERRMFKTGLTAKLDKDGRLVLHEMNSKKETTSSEAISCLPITEVIPNQMNEQETRLSYIWNDVLKHQSYTVTDNFFDVGGSSMSAVMLIAMINKEYGTNFTILDLFAHPNIRLLAVLIHTKDNISSESIDDYESALTQFEKTLKLLNNLSNE